MARRDARVARACVAQVTQFYLMDHPQSTLAILHHGVRMMRISYSKAIRRKLRLMAKASRETSSVSLKDKSAPARRFKRRTKLVRWGPPGMTARHPLAVIRAYARFARPVALGG